MKKRLFATGITTFQAGWEISRQMGKVPLYALSFLKGLKVLLGEGINV
ncbi:hypothetical protein [Alkalibacterium sp. 20]|nr:hypothetical protein [Alkalibacterium sp. 20]